MRGETEGNERETDKMDRKTEREEKTLNTDERAQRARTTILRIPRIRIDNVTVEK